MDAVPTRTQLMAMLAELREALDQLDDGAVIEVYDEAGRSIGTRKTPGLAYLLALMAAARRDGRPTRSFGGSAPSAVDADGEPLPPYSDRVGEVGSNPVKVADPIRVHGEQLVRNLAHALGDMRRARGHMISAFEDVKPAEGDPACAAHAAAGIFERAERPPRCLWCYRFWLAEKRTPPVELLRAKAEGRRITVQMVRDALSPPKPKKRRKVSA